MKYILSSYVYKKFLQFYLFLVVWGMEGLGSKKCPLFSVPVDFILIVNELIIF